MKDIELRLTTTDNNNWALEVYDPNVQHLIGAASKKFSGLGEAEVWLEAFGTLEKSRFIDREDFKVIRGVSPVEGFVLESLLSN